MLLYYMDLKMYVKNGVKFLKIVKKQQASLCVNLRNTGANWASKSLTGG